MAMVMIHIEMIWQLLSRNAQHSEKIDFLGDD